jgi:hypothetical protein
VRHHRYRYQSGVVTDGVDDGTVQVVGHLLHVSMFDSVGDPASPVSVKIGDGNPILCPTAGAFSTDHFGDLCVTSNYQVQFSGGGALYFVGWED